MRHQSRVVGNRYMAVAGQYLATEAAHAILQAGGNAIDAGVAGGIALGVVHCDQVQVSGVAPILIYLAERDEAVSIAGLGWWPETTDLGRFEREHGGGIPDGLLRTVIPAAPDAWITALSRYGTMRFADVAAAAIRYAREGFAVHAVMAAFFADYAAQYARWPSNRALFQPQGRPLREGERLVQPDLAAALQYMADEEAAHAHQGREAALEAARAAFYKGDLAVAMTRFHAENGGNLTMRDLASYRSEVEAPIRHDFHGTEVLSCGYWCQGPTLLQMLALLGNDDLRGMAHNGAPYIHLLTEAMNLCFADRERYVGDPRFIDVPGEILLSPAYAARRRQLIRPDRAFGTMAPAGHIPGFGSPSGNATPSFTEPRLPADTSYVCVVDAKGNVFSATPSDVSWDGPIIPGLGFCPSSRGSQSWGTAGHASAARAGKRPRLTPNPSIALRRGRFAMPFGAPGGDLQPQGMLQVFLNHVVFGMDLQEAIDTPRFVTRNFPDSFEPHPYYPGRLDLETGIDPAVGDTLAGYGHQVNWLPPLSMKTAGVCAISADLDAGILHGAADPRRTGRAMGL